MRRPYQLQRLKSKAAAGSDDTANAGRIQMRAGNEMIVVRRKRQQPQPALVRLV